MWLLAENKEIKKQESNEVTYQGEKTAYKQRMRHEYLKFSHFSFHEIVGIENGYAAVLHTVIYDLLLFRPIKALVRTLEVGFLQFPI